MHLTLRALFARQPAEIAVSLLTWGGPIGGALAYCLGKIGGFDPTVLAWSIGVLPFGVCFVAPLLPRRDMTAQARTA